MDDFENDNPGGEQPTTLSPRNPIQVIWRHRFLVLLGGAIGLILGALSYSQRPPVYQTAAKVLVVKKRSDVLPVKDGDPRMTFYEDYVSTHLVVICSPLIAAKAVERHKLRELKCLEKEGDPVGAILSGLVASRDVPKESGAPPNNILNLTLRCADSADAGVILAAVISAYREFLAETYKNVSDNTLEDLQKARRTLEADIALQNQKYSEFREKAGNILTNSEGLNVYESRIRTYQEQETKLLSQVEELRKRLDAIDQAKKEKTALKDIISLGTRPFDKQAQDNTLEMQLQTELHRLEMEEQKLLGQDLGAKHPDVQSVRMRIKKTQDHYKKLNQIGNNQANVAEADQARLDSVIWGLKSQLAVADAMLKANSALMTKAEAEAKKHSNVYRDDDIHRKAIARNNLLLDDTLKRLTQMNLIRDNGGLEAQVLSEPGPGFKVSPIAYQMLVGGLFLGLLLGVGAAYLLEISDKSFRTPEEIRARLRLPIVGHIPYLSERSPTVEIVTSHGTKVELDGALIEFHEPTSIEAEAYRSVRTALYFSTRGERHKVIQVTSPNMGDGKSTLISNLAVAIAQSGRKVIVVDADLRRPRIHRVFGLTARRGLAQVISGAATLEETIQQTVVGGLSVLPCGSRPTDPAELLTQARFGDILEELRETFDYVLIDTPPLLAVSDPCTVAPRVDGVILTIRVSKNGRPSAERAREMLAQLRVHIFGVVVNGVGKHGAMAGYGYEHYRYADEYTQSYVNGDTEHQAAEDSGSEDLMPAKLANELASEHRNGNGHVVSTGHQGMES